MATFDEKQQQVLNEINTLIKTSPASAKTEAQNLAIEPVAPEVVPPVVDYLNSQKIPEVDLAGVLSLGVTKPKAALNSAKLLEPIDKSIGVNIPEVGTDRRPHAHLRGRLPLREERPRQGSAHHHRRQMGPRDGPDQRPSEVILRTLKIFVLATLD